MASAAFSEQGNPFAIDLIDTWDSLDGVTKGAVEEESIFQPLHPDSESHSRSTPQERPNLLRVA